MAAGVTRAIALLLVACSALDAQQEADYRTVTSVVGTRLNRVEVWVNAVAHVGVTLVRGEGTVSCGAPIDEMRVWADSLTRFAEDLRGLSAVDTATRVSAPMPNCGIVGVGMRLGGARSYALRDVSAQGVELQVMMTAGTMQRLAADIRSAAAIVDNALDQIQARLDSLPAYEPLNLRATPLSTGQTYFDFQVDRQVRAVRGTASPRYPEALRSRGIEGEVLAHFVVDTTGLVIVETFRVLRASHPEFEAAVRASIPGLLFAPAIKDGRNVKQIVQQPFQFRLERER